jgi:hypothetical protein
MILASDASLVPALARFHPGFGRTRNQTKGFHEPAI